MRKGFLSKNRMKNNNTRRFVCLLYVSLLWTSGKLRNFTLGDPVSSAKDMMTVETARILPELILIARSVVSLVMSLVFLF